MKCTQCYGGTNAGGHRASSPDSSLGKCPGFYSAHKNIQCICLKQAKFHVQPYVSISYFLLKAAHVIPGDGYVLSNFKVEFHISRSKLFTDLDYVNDMCHLAKML